jgi:hypothetical protein
LKKIPIIHLYGKLGLLPWEKTDSDDYAREYNPSITPHYLRKSSSSLKIIYDKVDEKDLEFKQARQLLQTATKIYFLGFGFHKDNLLRLRMKYFNDVIPPPLIEGTSYRLSQDLRESIPKMYKIKFPNHDWDINEFLEQKIRLT